MSGYAGPPRHPCLICGHLVSLSRLLCLTCATPEPDREPTTEWRRARVERRANEQEGTP